MIKLYNTINKISTDLYNFFKNVSKNIFKPQLKLIPNIITSMIEAESVVTTDMVKKLKGDFRDVSPFSNVRRFERFFNTSRFSPYLFFEDIITYVINNYKLGNQNVYIAFDHSFCKDHFTVFSLSLRIGKQGIPLWFRCFKGDSDPDAFKISLINEGISFVHNLFKDKKCNLIFLADRWFNFREIMAHIENLGDTYCIRTKGNILIKINNYEYSGLIQHVADIEPTLTKSKYFDDVEITNYNFKTKLAVSKSDGHEEPFYILTNGNTREAIKHYGYRFGAIEFIFKNQKSNGFYLEATKMRNLHAFTTLFTLVSVAIIWLTIIGADYTKNQKHFKNYFKIRMAKRFKNGSRRTLSLFNTGLFLFNLAIDSTHYFVLKTNFVLYDL